MTNARYRLYREHKYVTFMLSSFSAEVAKLDFSLNENVIRIKGKLSDITALIYGHAAHENERIHTLLRNKNSLLHEKSEAEHRSYKDVFEKLNQQLMTILENTDAARRVLLGHQFYIEVQRFEAENLLHQIYEETVIMSELQRLYTDEEILNQVDAHTYAIMTPDQMIHMLVVLFPHFNADDREAFLKDLYQAESTKFMEAWNGISSMIEVSERGRLAKQFGLNNDA